MKIFIIGTRCILAALAVLIVLAGTRVALCDNGKPTADEAALSASLLPAPRAISISGAPQSIQIQGYDKDRGVAGPIRIAVQYEEASLPFDPISVVLSGIANRGKVTYMQPGKGFSWSLIVHSSDTEIAQDDFKLLSPDGLPPEGYRIRTFPGKNGILAVIAASDARGLLYGAQTLSQLLLRDPGMLDDVEIEDYPDIAVRELHIHGFDKGYIGAGNLASLAEYTDQLPQLLPLVSSARFNLFRIIMDAGWISNANGWVDGDLDSVMRNVVSQCHNYGVDFLVGIRFEGMTMEAGVPKFYPLNPIDEWGKYEKAFRRVLSWGVDAVDLSFNDIGPIEYGNVTKRYGEDGRFSGELMGELLQKCKAIIDKVKPDTQLHHMPKFYSSMDWAAYPDAMPELCKLAPRGTVIYSGSNLLNPTIQSLRNKYGAHFERWMNLTSGHCKELRVLLDTPTPKNVRSLVDNLPLEERRVMLNLGYPVEPQESIALASGEALWNIRAYKALRSFAKGARTVWGKGPDELLLHYSNILDKDTILSSLGQSAAALLKNGTAKKTDIGNWSKYLSKAKDAAATAQDLREKSADYRLKQVADVLYWNAERVRLDSQVGLMIATALSKHQPLDKKAVQELLREHELILRDHYPIPENDPKSAEVSRRGIRQIRSALHSYRSDGNR